MANSSIQNVPMFEPIVEQLLQIISSGEISVGDFFPSERAFSERFGVSRTVVREAIHVLEQKGYVTSGKGKKRKLLRTQPFDNEFTVIVDQLERAKIEDLLDARTYLDDIIVTLACMRATKEDILDIEKSYILLEQNYSVQQHSAEKGINADLFHLSIAKATHNDVLINIYQMSISLMSSLRSQSLRSHAAQVQMLEEHRNIFLGIRDKNIVAARLAAQIHSRNSKHRYGISDNIGSVN